MKTQKQIADELGVDKQRVYRWIKRNHIKESHQEARVMYYDEAAELAIKSGFLGNTVSDTSHHEAENSTSNEAVLIQMLQNELDVKNRQIEDLSRALVAAQDTAKAAQALHAATVQQSLIGAGDVDEDPGGADPDEDKGFWRRLFKRK